MINANRYRHTGRTYVNISRAPLNRALNPGANAPGYESTAPSALDRIPNSPDILPQETPAFLSDRSTDRCFDQIGAVRRVEPEAV
jgi:hypothetical protein